MKTAALKLFAIALTTSTMMTTGITALAKGAKEGVHAPDQAAQRTVVKERGSKESSEKNIQKKKSSAYEYSCKDCTKKISKEELKAGKSYILYKKHVDTG